MLKTLIDLVLMEFDTEFVLEEFSHRLSRSCCLRKQMRKD